MSPIEGMVLEAKTCQAAVMEFVVGLLGVVAAVVIPVYLHQKNHPRRELRYAIVPAQSSSWRLLVWSTGRADIPSASFDAGRPIVFAFTAPVDVTKTQHHSNLVATSPIEIHLPARLLHRDFSDEITLTVSTPFDVRVDHPLIDIPLVHDETVEQAAAPATQERAVRKSRARAHVTLLMVSIWLVSASFALFVVGIALTFVDQNLGAGLGIPGMLLFPVGVVMLLIAMVRRLIARRRERHLRRPAV